MEIRFNPATAAPATASVPEGERVAVRWRAEAEPPVETDRVDLQSRAPDQRVREAEQARAPEEKRRLEPPPQVAHYVFEYEGKHTILRLQDSKGALIYQVPPQGRLTLLMEEEKSAARLRDTA